MLVWLIVHNPYKWYEYTHEWVAGAQFQNKGPSDSCDSQLLETLQSYARGGLWCTTNKFGSKLGTWGVVVHNSEMWHKVTQVVDCGAQLLKRVRSCACWGFYCKTRNFDTKFCT